MQIICFIHGTGLYVEYWSALLEGKWTHCSYCSHSCIVNGAIRVSPQYPQNLITVPHTYHTHTTHIHTPHIQTHKYTPHTLFRRPVKVSINFCKCYSRNDSCISSWALRLSQPTTEHFHIMYISNVLESQCTVQCTCLPLSPTPWSEGFYCSPCGYLHRSCSLTVMSLRLSSYL